MATLFLIRHAEPRIRGVFLGQLDPPLSESGRAQAHASRANLHVAIAYTSPLRRARETAQSLRQCPIQVVEALREIHQGEWTGKTWSEIEARWSDIVHRKRSDWLGVTPPGAEPWPQFFDRIRAAWQTIRQGPEPAAVVGHQAVNAALANLAAAHDPLAFSQHYAEVTCVEFRKD